LNRNPGLRLLRSLALGFHMPPLQGFGMAPLRNVLKAERRMQKEEDKAIRFLTRLRQNYGAAGVGGYGRRRARWDALLLGNFRLEISNCKF
jgi:hypothetical protein